MSEITRYLHVEFLISTKYLGITVSSVLSDELDIKAQVRSIA